jgi:hypothetical protein
MAADAKPSRGLRDSSAVRRDIALALKDVPVFEYGDEINDYTPVRFFFCSNHTRKDQICADCATFFESVCLRTK